MGDKAVEPDDSVDATNLGDGLIEAGVRRRRDYVAELLEVWSQSDGLAGYNERPS